MASIHKNGHRISVEFTIVPIKYGAGQMEGFAAVMTDVTKRFDELRSLKQQITNVAASTERC